MNIEFDDITIQKLFGHEAAEDEPIERLKEYYYKTRTFSQATAELPLRLVVSHKGIGKSALFKIAYNEDLDTGRLPIMIRPDDISEIAKDDNNFLLTIKDWTNGLKKIIVSKILTEFGAENKKALFKLKSYSGKLIDFLLDMFKGKIEGVSLLPMNQLLIKKFLENGKINIYIDDLDRGWEGKLEDIKRISALINSVRDISRDNLGLNFRIAFRSDVYYLFRTSDESTDKVEGSVVWLEWTNFEIFVLLVKRIETFFGNHVKERELLRKKPKELALSLNRIMEQRFRGEGLWQDVPMYKVMMSLIRKRPRDLIKLCTLAARKAFDDESSKINTKHFKEIFDSYSQSRLQDTINEFKSELPLIENLLFNMKQNKKERMSMKGMVFKTSHLLQKISNVMQNHQFYYSNGQRPTNKELAAFMYKINFLTARKGGDDRYIIRKYFEDNKYLSSPFYDFGFDWEIHPAYRWALQPDNPNDIFKDLHLNSDESI